MSVDRTLQSIADVLADHEAAYHPGQLCPEDQHGHCAARPRPVPSPEDRMADARTDTPTAEHTAARTFNDTNPIGTPVRYWKGAREGDGKVARTRTQAQLLSGHTAVVWLEGVSGCIALTHIQPISEEELAAADRIPAPRPVPTFADRTAALEELREERVKTGRLEGDLRSQTRAVREALAERNALRHQLDTAREDAYRDIARQIDILAADPGILRDWLTTCHPQPISFGELFHALAEKLRRPTPPPSSVPSRRAQEADLEPWIRRAAADPGSIAGRRRGPCWVEGEEGYAEQQESVPAWITRAVLRVLAKDGQPHCERCSQVIRVNDMYDPPLPGIGLWEHKGTCPPVEATP